MKLFNAYFSAEEKLRQTKGETFVSDYIRMVKAYDAEDAIVRIKKKFQSKGLKVFGFRSVVQSDAEML